MKILAELTKRIGNLYRRLYAHVLELPPITMHSEMPQLQQMSADLAAYDCCLLGYT